MHIVQSVRLAPDAKRVCFVSETHASTFFRGNTNNLEEVWRIFPAWFTTYNSLHHTFRSAFCCQLDSASVTPEQLREAFNRCQPAPLGDYLFFPESTTETQDPPQTSPLEAHLFYEPHLRQWLILYRISFAFKEADLERILRKSLTLENSRNDFYNSLRDVFVISDGKNQKANFVCGLEEEARMLIAQKVYELYGTSINAQEDIEIVESSGNISFLVTPTPLFEQMDGCRLLKEVHERAERSGSSANALNVPDTVLYIFWGRFHTIISTEANAEARFMPIQFQAQLIWSYLSSMDLVMQELEETVLTRRLSKESDCSDYMDALINSIHYAGFMNEEFKRSIEGDSTSVYTHVEKRWDLQGALQRLKGFAQYLSEYIERDFQKRSLVSESRQNNILSAIAILGVLALIDTWGTYLTLVSEPTDSVLQNTVIHGMFSTGDALAVFNTWFPIIVTGICIIAIVYIFARKQK